MVLLLWKKHANIISKYRTVEFSVLRKSRAANLLTGIAFGSKNSMADLREQDKQDLVNTLGSEIAVEETENGLAIAEQLLEAVGINSKVVEEPVEEEKKEDPEKESFEEIRGKLYKDFNVAGIEAANKSVIEGLVELTNLVKEQATQIKALADRLNKVEKSEDEKIAAAYQAPLFQVFQTSTKVEEDEAEKIEALKKTLPESHVTDKESGAPETITGVPVFQAFRSLGGK